MQVCPAVFARMVMSVIAVLVTLFIYFFIIGNYRAAFRAGNDLYKVKGEGTCIAYGTHLFALIARAYCLAGIFQQQQFVLLAYRHQLIHLAHAAAHMHRHYRLCTRSYSRRYRLRIQRQCFIYIHQHRYGAYRKYRFKAGYESERRHDDLITRAYAQCCHRSSQRCCAAAQQLCITCTKRAADLRFQFLGLPYTIAGAVKTIAHKDPCFQYIIHFLALLCAK